LEEIEFLDNEKHENKQRKKRKRTEKYEKFWWEIQKIGMPIVVGAGS